MRVAARAARTGVLLRHCGRICLLRLSGLLGVDAHRAASYGQPSGRCGRPTWYLAISRSLMARLPATT
jgi:hypothetical protein